MNNIKIPLHIQFVTTIPTEYTNARPTNSFIISNRAKRVSKKYVMEPILKYVYIGNIKIHAYTLVWLKY